MNWEVILPRRPISELKLLFICQRGEFIEIISNSLNMFPTQLFSVDERGQFQHTNLRVDE